MVKGMPGNLVQDLRLNHRLEVERGVGESQAAALLSVVKSIIRQR